MAVPAETGGEQHAYRFIGTPENVVERGEKFWLRITLNDRGFDLPLVDVGTPEKTVAVAWLNPDPTVNPELAQAASETTRKTLLGLHTNFVVMTASSKSEWYIQNAVARLSECTLVRLPSYTDRGRAVDESMEGSMVEYMPVTGLATNTPKYMGLPKNFAELVRQFSFGTLRMTLVDDVYTTGATLRAMEMTIEPFGKYMQATHHIAVLAREAAFEVGYPPNLPPGLHASIALPEFIGRYPAGSLIPIAQRNTPEGIPKAIAL
jgi:hypothetical protein